MSAIETAKRFCALLDAHDLAGLEEILADDFIGRGPAVELDKQQLLDYVQALFTAFPDLSFGMAGFEEEDDLVYCTNRETGTHNGLLDLRPFGVPLSLPPTGKSFELPPGRYVIQVANDQVTHLTEKVAEGGGMSELLAQLGVELP